MNWEAQPLNQHEIDQVDGDKEVERNMLASYDLMLDFYGARRMTYVV
jgi:hypothetical protein